jgi:hypothetical protein
MNLVYGRVVITKSELIVLEVFVNGWVKAFKCEFSNTLEKKGRRLIGLYELGESAGFPDLSIIIMIENFQSRGKYESMSMEL